MTHTIWHPYPETVPTPQDRQRRFLVTIRAPVVHKRAEDSQVTVARWTGRKFYAYDNMVLAWAYLPPPYTQTASDTH